MIGCSFSLPSYRRRRAPYDPGGGVRGGTSTCTAWLHCVGAVCGCAVWVRNVAVPRTWGIVVRRIVSGVLSTGVIHSVENLHACDLVEQPRGLPQMQFKGSAEKFL